MEFKRDGQPVELSKTEQKLLYLLASNPGVTLSRERLVDYVWTDGTVCGRKCTVGGGQKAPRQAGRQKDRRTYIRTVYGIGYVWAVNEVE